MSTVDTTFGRFGLDSYERFLRAKKIPGTSLVFDRQADRYTITAPARFADALGVEAPVRPRASGRLSSHLFDYQRFIVKRALEAKRYACWADTGLGKTAILLEWARHVEALTGEGVLILSPLAVIGQTISEAQTFYGNLQILRLRTRDQLAEWCAAPDGLAITNYEKLIAGQLPELRNLGGLAADESSILKTGGGTIKWNLIKSARGIEYKLSLTATPAPNDLMEYASQAALLEALRYDDEILWTYFSRDKAGGWRVKPHARAVFYEFMAGWSIYLADPAAYGFADVLAGLPDPQWHEHRVAMTAEQRVELDALLVRTGRGLFDDRMGVRERSKLAQVARGFVYEGAGKQRAARAVPSRKPQRVASLANEEVEAGRPTIVWTTFDEEARILASLCGGRVAVLQGDTPPAERAALIGEFRAGRVDVLITKAQLAGYGLNLQHCQAMVFSGFDDSYERRYQAVRRAYRFGQTKPVHVHDVVVPELEGMVLDNVRAKERRFAESVGEQERYYKRALDLGQTERAA